LDTILHGLNHPAIGMRQVDEEVFTPIEQYTADDLADKEIVEKDGKKYVKTSNKKDIYGYKMNK
jgi:hypothetical protein